MQPPFGFTRGRVHQCKRKDVALSVDRVADYLCTAKLMIVRIASVMRIIVGRISRRDSYPAEVGKPQFYSQYFNLVPTPSSNAFL